MVLRKRHRRIAGAVALLSFLNACTVTPEPIAEQQQIERTKADLAVLRSIEFVPTRPITLHEAMARAVAFNLKRRVSQIERSITEAELEQSNYEMLPTLEIGAKKNRTDVPISSSDDRITKTADASFTWNLLDLGVSYARAKQRADEVLIAREKERKALQDIIRQVNTAYWRAATGDRLLRKVGGLARDLKLAMEASRRMEESRATDVISAVAFRREVVESVRQALTVQRELSEAKSELAELLNIRPGTEFTLALPAERVADLRLPMSAQEMEQHALLNRPELRIEDYNERIGDWQAREAIYEMLPGLDLSVGRNYSSESSNLSPNWISTGLNLGMNIFNLFSASSEVDAADRRSELARQQRLAMSLAVLTQLHIARVKFRNAEQQMRLVKEIADSDRHLTRLVSTNGQFLNKDFFEAVRLATRQMNSEMDEQRTFVELVSSHAEVMHAIGQDVLPEKVPLDDIPALAGAIRDMTASWYAAAGPANGPAPARREAAPMDRLVDAILPPHRPAATAALGPATTDGDDGPPLLETAEFDREDGDREIAAVAAPDDMAASADEADGEAAAEAPQAPADRPAEDNPSRIDAALSGRADDGNETVAGVETHEPAPDTVADMQAAAPASPATSAAARELPEPAGAADTERAAGIQEKPPADAPDEPAAIADPETDVAADAVARLNDIAPASRGGSTVTFRTPGEWELLPSAPYQPAVAASADNAGPGRKPGKSFVVSLGAFSQQENAFRLHAEVGARSSGLFGSTAVRVVLRPGGNGATYYFVQTDPMPDRRAAVTLCRSLKRAGRACNVSALAN